MSIGFVMGGSRSFKCKVKVIKCKAKVIECKVISVTEDISVLKADVILNGGD